MNIRNRLLLTACLSLSLLFAGNAEACTGITLVAKDSSRVVVRTIEWGGSDLNSRYVIVPRGFEQQSYTPQGVNGMKFKARYGYVGLAVEQKEFVAEGLNEAFNPSLKATSVADLQVVSFVLATCKTVDEVKQALKEVQVIAVDPRASTVHWRFADPSGRQIVLEIVDGKLCFYENELGVLTNSPGFDWQLTNLNNYVNLYPGSADGQQLGTMKLKSFGAGSGFLGIPGDVTPPSRFVRAAFYQSTAPTQDTGADAVLQGFQILNNFDIPVGIEFADGKIPANIPSATQWTSATDITNRVIYYRTMYNSAIRGIDLKKIDFSQVHYKVVPLDAEKRQPVTFLNE